MILSGVLLVLSLLPIEGNCEDDEKPELILNKNQFFIYNKKYHKDRIYIWGGGYKDVGTFHHELKDDQLWLLDEHPQKKGCYYMINERHKRCRLANHGWHNLIVYCGPYYSDQLWSFNATDDGYYHIINCKRTNHRLAKYGSGKKEIITYKGNFYEDQKWSLVPRFTAELYTNEVFHYDNLQGSTPIKREVTITTGIKRKTATTIRNKLTYKYAMEKSIQSVTDSHEFTSEIETTFHTSSETNFSKTEKITFTIPAHKNFRVMQHAVDFKAPLPDDACTLLTNIKIFESDTLEFDDPSGFIIGKETKQK